MKAADNNLLTFKADQLLYLKDEKDRPLRRATLDIPRQRQLLNSLKGTAQELIYGMLLRTHFEALDFHSAFSSIYAHLTLTQVMEVENLSLLKISTHMNALGAESLSMVTQGEKSYAEINLTAWEDMLVASAFNDEMEFWKKLMVQDDTVGYVWIKNNSIQLFVDRDIIINGEIELSSLRINSLKDVQVHAPLTLAQQFEVYCQQLVLKAKIQASELHLFCLSNCAIQTALEAEHIQIKSSHLAHQGKITAKKKMLLLAEDIEIHGALVMPVEGLSLIAKTITTNGQIHSESSVQLIALKVNQEQKTAIYTRKLDISAHEIILKGRNVVDGDAQIVASDSPGVLETKDTAELFITGHLKQAGRWVNRFAGFLRQVDPSVPHAVVSQVLLSSDHHLSVSGALRTNHAAIILCSGRQLEFSGAIWATSFFEAAMVALKSHTLMFQGHVVADKPVLLQAQEDMMIGGHIQGEKIHIQTEGQLTFNTTDLEAKQVSIRSGGDSKIAKDQVVTIQSDAWVSWHCHNFYSEGVLDVAKLQLRAERLIQLSRAKMLGQEHLYEATYIIASSSRLLVQDRLSLSSYVSTLFGVLVCSDNFTNNALFNASLSLYLPARLRLTWPGILSVAMAVVQTALTVIQMVFVHMPPVQVGVTIARIVLNSIPAFYNLYQQARQLHQLQRLPDDRFTVLNWLLGIKAILYTMASLAISGYMASLPPGADLASAASISILPQSIEDAIRKLDELTANWLSMFPGERNNSLINLNLGMGLGWEQVNSNLFNLNTGFFGFISSFNSSALQLDPATLNLNALSAATGVWDYQLGNVVPLPFGSHSYRFWHIYSDPLLPLAQSHMNLMAQTWITSSDQQYSDCTVQAGEWIIPGHQVISGTKSHFKVDQIEQNGTLILVDSLLKTKLFIEGPYSVEQWSRSSFQMDQFKQNGTDNFWQCTGKVKIYDISKTGKAFYFYSALDIQQWRDAGVTQWFASQAAVDEFTIGGLFAAEAQSNLHGHKLQIDKEAQIGSRTSDWNFDQFSDDGDPIPDLIAIDDRHDLHPLPPHHHPAHHGDENASADSVSQHHLHPPAPPFHPSHATQPKDKDDGLHYTADHSYTAHLTEDGSIIYSSLDNIELHDEKIISVSGIGYQAPSITLSGHNQADALMLLADENITMRGADNQFSGELILDAKNITMDASKTVAGAMACYGDNLSLKNGAKAVTQGSFYRLICKARLYSKVSKAR